MTDILILSYIFESLDVQGEYVGKSAICQRRNSTINICVEPPTSPATVDIYRKQSSDLYI